MGGTEIWASLSSPEASNFFPPPACSFKGTVLSFSPWDQETDNPLRIAGDSFSKPSPLRLKAANCSLGVETSHIAPGAG